MILGKAGIRTQILFTIVGVVASAFALLYFVATPVLSSALLEDRVEHSKWLSTVLVNELVQDCQTVSCAKTHIQSWNRTGVCVALIDGRGKYIASSSDLMATCSGPRDKDEIAKIEPNTHRVLGSTDSQVLAVSVGLPDSRAGNTWGASDVRLLYLSSLETVGQRMALSKTLILLFMLLGLALVTVFGYAVLTQLIVRPTNRLVRAVERVTLGDMSAHAEPTGAVELRALAAAFNNLTAKLRDDDQKISMQISELRDINSQLEQATDNLVRSEKMASVGKLAAGVAHEIGNPISIVSGYLEMLRRSDATDEEKVLWLEQTADAVQRVDTIIRDLLNYSRLTPTDEDDIANVGEVIEATLKLVGPQAAFKTVDIAVESPPEPIVAMISESRLQQILVNLLMNAADSIADHVEPSITVTLSSNATNARLDVVDNGPGLSPKDRRQVFDPFFTTKEPGKGTGLGLSICYSIVHACGGQIRCDSVLGKGATFTVTLPLALEGSIGEVSD